MNANQTKMVLETFPTDKSIMLVAKHGVGKSSVVKQVAQENGWGFHDVRLSQCEVGDIKGLPYLDTANMQTTFLKPKWWPRDQDSCGILFFDELNRATKDVLQAVFEICLDRRLDGEKLPKGWRVVAAINGSEDYDVIELDPALFDRWFVVDFDPSPKEWLAWARKNGVHEAIVDFVGANSNLLDPPVGNLEAGRIYPSRRSWVQFHETAMALGLLDKPDDATLTQVCKGWLGREISATFPKYLQNEFSRLRAEDIINGYKKIREKVEAACSDMEVISSVSNSVLAELKKMDTVTDKQRDNLKEFFIIIPADTASAFWVEFVKLKVGRKIVPTWQADKDVNERLQKIFCR